MNTTTLDPAPPAARALGALLTDRQAAEYLGFSLVWLRQTRQAPVGRDGQPRRRPAGPPYLRLGRSIRYRIADLDAWLATHRVRSSEERGGE